MIRPLIAALLLSLLVSTPARADDDRLKRSTAELEQVRQRIERLNQSLQKDRGEQDALRASLEEAERRISSAVARLRELDQNIRAQDRKVARTRGERRDAQIGLDEQKQALATQVRSAYLVGQQARTKLLLNQEDPAALSRVMTYYDYVNRARTERIHAINAQIEFLRAIEARLQAEVDELAALRKQQESQLTQLEAGRAEREVAMERIESRIRDQGSELKQLAADEQALNKLIQSLRDLLADIPADLGSEKPFGRQKGRLPWPFKGRILADYGAPKAGGQLRWNGVWIGGKAGDPVRAVARGRVAYVGWMHRYGLIAVLEHSGGYYTLYGHNQAVFKSVGEWVNAGETLSSVGDTGGHEHSGLYFEIRKGTDPINPRPWLRS